MPYRAPRSGRADEAVRPEGELDRAVARAEVEEASARRVVLEHAAPLPPFLESLADERIVAFLIYWLVHDEVHILNVAVAPDQRRKGIARMLMAETERRAHQAGAALMTLEVRRSNQSALDLYREFDYRAVGVRPNYYVDEGEDAIVMVKELKRPR